MYLVVMLLSLMVLAFNAVAEECPSQEGIRIPCATIQTTTKPLRVHRFQEQTPLEIEMFSKGELARDATPEHLAALNDPTWENIRTAAIARLYRNYKILLVTKMIDAVTQAIVADVKTRTRLTDADYMTILETIAREHGLQTYHHSELGLTESVVGEKVRRAMEQLSLGGR